MPRSVANIGKSEEIYYVLITLLIRGLFSNWKLRGEHLFLNTYNLLFSQVEPTGIVFPPVLSVYFSLTPHVLATLSSFLMSVILLY